MTGGGMGTMSENRQPKALTMGNKVENAGTRVPASYWQIDDFVKLLPIR